MKYKQANNGEWFDVPPEGVKFKCCGCGLVHLLDFEVVRVSMGDHLRIRFIEDKRATAQCRRYMSIKTISENMKIIDKSSNIVKGGS